MSICFQSNINKRDHTNNYNDNKKMPTKIMYSIIIHCYRRLWYIVYVQ